MTFAMARLYGLFDWGSRMAMLGATAGVCSMSQFNVVLVQEILTVSCHVSMMSKAQLSAIIRPVEWLLEMYS
jgi:hypothetical protein